MLLLHISDLHFGPQSRFVDEEPARLGMSFHRALDLAIEHLDLKERIELVIITGDVAESAKPKEFEAGAQFLRALANELALEHRRFVFVPGNHDISWTACKKVEADQEEEGFGEEEFRRRLDSVKLCRYEEFLKKFYEVTDLCDVALPLARGAYVYNFHEFNLSIGALNSCERESHRRLDHLGHISQEQAESLMTEWRSPERSNWLKIVAVHHNPVVTVPANISSWREYLSKANPLHSELIARYESDVVGFDGKEHLKHIIEDNLVQLVLHGHHHAKDEHQWAWRRGVKGYAHVLSAGSLSLRPENLPRSEPASVRLIELNILAEELRAWSFVYEEKARPAGELRTGSFIPSPIEPDPYIQRLDLPLCFAVSENSRRAQTSSNFSPFLRTYRQSLSHIFSRWDLGSAGVTYSSGTRRPIEASLDSMYLVLRFAPGFDINDTSRGAPIFPEKLLTRDKPLVIRGAAGAGKTTWARWTLRQLANLEQALPLMLVIRDLARRWRDIKCQGVERSLIDFLDSWIGERMGKGWEGKLEKFLESSISPRPILLVDGWDEAGPLGDELRDKILSLNLRYPRLLVVVTSRPYGESRPSHSDGFEVLDIQPLSNREIRDFSERFFTCCQTSDSSSTDQEVLRFCQALDNSQEVSALARNTLLLTMMLLISRSRPLPDKRHLLYEACVENLLSALPDRKSEEGALIGRQQWRPRDNDVRRRALAAVAWSLQYEGYRGIGRSAIIRRWDEMLRLLPPEWSTTQCSGFLAWLSGAAGLLSDYTDGTLSFSHLSFQEYLAAWHINAITEGGERISIFKNYITQEAWWETLRLWAALIDRQSPERTDQIIDFLMKDTSDGFLLAGTILADGLGTDSRFHDWILLLIAALDSGWPAALERCSQAWATSRQDGRKLMLAKWLGVHAEEESWLTWMRFNEFFTAAALPGTLTKPREVGSRVIISQELTCGINDYSDVAFGRLLCAGQPLWPNQSIKIGLLQTWPSSRRVAGTLAQLAVICGAQRADLQTIANELISPVAWYDAFEVGSSSHLPESSISWLRSLAMSYESTRSGAQPTWLNDFYFCRQQLEKVYEARRYLVRGPLAAKQHPTTQLLRSACLLYFHPDWSTTPLEEILLRKEERLDPLWKSLARYLAYQASQSDLQLLTHLAQFPEEREPPLSWGLQFIVRGDIMLPSGEILTLDQLADDAGLPRLPLIDNLPVVPDPELEMFLSYDAGCQVPASFKELGCTFR